MHADSGLVDGPADHHRRSPWPARLDLLQSTSGLVLAVFMWGHLFFVASILVSEEFMWAVTRMFEGYFLFGRAYPGIVSLIVALVALIFALHAALALRKFPASHGQYRAFQAHRRLLRHADTNLWWVQVVTGFLLFFLATPHLYQMLMHPAAIGPYASADRTWSGAWWSLYLPLLFCVELHGGIGLYRLAVKWGWFQGEDAVRARARLKAVKWALTAFLLVLGLLTLAAYMKIGYEHRGQVGERFMPVVPGTP